jgi:hypothetical protein
MGFAHSVIEDTLIVMALGADVGGVLVGRLAFAVAATAAIAGILRIVSDEAFFTWTFRKPIALRTTDDDASRKPT